MKFKIVVFILILVYLIFIVQGQLTLDDKDSEKAFLVKKECDLTTKYKTVINYTCKIVEDINYSTKEIVKYEVCEPYTTEISYQVCKKEDEKLTYKDSELKYVQKEQECVIDYKNNRIVCDDRAGKDGNGDGICQSGETCYYYDLTDKIEFAEAYNGAVKIR